MSTLNLRVIVPNNPQFDLPSNPDGRLIGINIQSLVGASLPCWVQAFENMGGHTVQIHIQAGIGLAPGPTPVWSALIPAGHQVDLQVDVPRAMISEGTFELFAVVISPTSQNREETPRLSVKIDFQAPDGASLKPIIAKPANPGFIGREDLQNGIEFEVAPYANRKQFDTIRLELPGGIIFEHVLRDIPVEGRPVSFHVGENYLTGFVGLMEANLNYRVYDDVRNLSVLSPTAVFLVDGNPNALPPPRFLDAVDGSVDLSRLQGTNTRVMVLNLGFLINDSVVLDYQLYHQDGTVEKGFLTAQVNSLEDNLIYKVPGNPNHSLSAGVLIVYYRDTQGRRSALASVPLTGELSGMDFGDDQVLHPISTYYVVKDRPPKNPHADYKASIHRLPIGGTAPYTYESSDDAVAAVDKESGLVVATGTGVAFITATDARQHKASYKIICRDVKKVVLVEGQQWGGVVGGPRRPEFTSLTRAQLRELYQLYQVENGGKTVPEILGWTSLPADAKLWSGDNDTTSPNAYYINAHVRPWTSWGASIGGLSQGVLPSVMLETEYLRMKAHEPK